MTGKRLSVKTLIYGALFVALMSIGAFIKIPVYPIPVTLQAQFAALAGQILGRRRGAATMAVYLFAGLLGLPVFALGGGFSYILKPTFGYLAGFIAGAYLSGLLSEKGRPSFKRFLTAQLCGLLILYAFGMAHYFLITFLTTQKILGLWALLSVGFFPTIPWDLLLCAPGAALALRLKKTVF